MDQPEAILKDSEKALRLYKAGEFDRFDDLCLPGFWVSMVEIMREELVKALAAEQEPVEITDEMVDRAAESWIVAPGDFVHDRMRAALSAALSEPRPEVK